MSFGSQTVTLVSFAEAGNPGALGTYAMTEILTEVPGCRHRPLTFQETAETDTDIATEMWKTTIPLFELASTLLATVMAIEAINEIRIDGNTYEIIGGVRPHEDFTDPFKATIISQKQTG